jgi:zinc transport system permease protein
VGGLWLSYTLQVPSGAAIIFFSIVVYALAKSVKSIYLCKTKH